MINGQRLTLPAVNSTWLERIGQWWESPWRSGLLALIVYGLCALRWQASGWAYFNYLADAFLHGQLYLRLMPPTTTDLVYFGGRYFLYWPPLPAILLLPFVAMFGANFSDTLFTLSVGVLNVALVSALLRAANRRGVIDLTTAQRGWLVMFFALGTYTSRWLHLAACGIRVRSSLSPACV